MIIMALDHTRDFFHAGAMSFQPDNLARTTPLLFLTRWVTHICAPTFMLLAGMGASLRLQRGASKAALSHFLWTRGLWLIVAELTIMRFAMNFTFDTQYPWLLVIFWALGVSMIALAALIHLPMRALAVLSVAIILLHNAFDGVQASGLGAYGWIWNALHQPGAFVSFGGPVVFGYPVLPWIAVMALGYCLGRLFALEPSRRRRLLATGGAAMIAAFVVIRAINVYGDPSPWAWQPGLGMTVLSFLRATKYPPSLQFLLMTLGPALLLLAWFDRRALRDDHPLVTIGRVPFFFFVAHFFALHVAASFMAWLRYGAASVAFLSSPLPSMGGARERFPADFGYPLWVVYAAWIGVVLLMYPLCRWFARVKRDHRAWWLSYV
jgi:uncharacterized membrane protein